MLVTEREFVTRVQRRTPSTVSISIPAGLRDRLSIGPEDSVRLCPTGPDSFEVFIVGGEAETFRAAVSWVLGRYPEVLSGSIVDL